jgi:hypothetical protein
MSESVKPRFAVDLNEIERQIAQAQGAPSQSGAATRGDPLAELARIVGQEDPFQSILSHDRAARPRNQANAGLDDLFAVREEPATAKVAQFPVRQAASAQPTYQDPYPEAVPQAAAPAYGYQDQGHDAYDAGAYGHEYYDENAPEQADQGYGQVGPEDYVQRQKPRSRKGLIAAGALLGAVVIGGGGAYLLSGNSASFSGGEPPLIQASNEPTKVQPQNPGGVEIPNQNKQIYERANQNADTKVVSREEQPVDVKQTVRMNNGAGDATGATGIDPVAPPRPPANGLNLGEPRKVRTVTIRPDGTVTQPEVVNARPPAGVLPTMSLPPAAQAGAPAPRSTPQAAASTPAAAPAPKPVQAAAAPAASTPAPAAATPASGASPQRVASVQPVAVAPGATPEVAATGGFAVQLGVRGSEKDAQSALEQLQKKFSDLGGMPPMIRKAEVNGKSVYRVRVGPMSQDEASSLCSKLRGQGGECYVAKN